MLLKDLEAAIRDEFGFMFAASIISAVEDDNLCELDENGEYYIKAHYLLDLLDQKNSTASIRLRNIVAVCVEHWVESFNKPSKEVDSIDKPTKPSNWYDN